MLLEHVELLVLIVLLNKNKVRNHAAWQDVAHAIEHIRLLVLNHDGRVEEDLKEED